MKDYLENIRKRSQLILILGNTLLVSLNLLYTAHKFDTLGNKQVFACQMTSAYTSLCYEQ